MFIFTIQKECNCSDFSNKLGKWLQIPLKNIDDLLIYNTESINISEHYFLNFYNNFLKNDFNFDFDIFKKYILSGENNDLINDTLFKKYGINIFIYKIFI